MDNVIIPPPPPAPLAVPEQVAFTGARGQFAGLVTRGAFLELITVGFYRFWLATDMRRHLWSHTSVRGDALEYTGTAKELFIGFLFAIAILAPVYFVYFLLGIEAERYQAFASVPLGLFYYLFIQFAIYRARRYRLTRTVWRGLRFSMGGSGWNYSWRAGLWLLFVMLTFGLALPWRQAALERFKMRHTFYGDLPGRFAGTGWDFFKRGWWLWLLAWPSLFLIVPLPFIYAAYKATEWRWWVSGIRLGEVRFESGMTGGALIGLYWKVILWSLLLSILLSVWVGLVFGVPLYMSGVFQGGSENSQKILLILQQPLLLIQAAVGYVIVALAIMTVTRIYLVRDLWQKVAATTRIHNLGVADNVTAQGEMVGALGEGFADSLDIAGF